VSYILAPLVLVRVLSGIVDDIGFGMMETLL
jgi:hypothetical protein